MRAAGAITVTVNGEGLSLPDSPVRTLLQALREELHLTGAKYGCGEGACGVCTVLVDGEPTRACTTPLAEVDGRAVTTVEGLGSPAQLHPVQRSFVEERAFQCGYCTPGMVVAAAALLERSPRPDEAAVRGALEGHICRCGTQRRILRAVAGVATVPSPLEWPARLAAGADTTDPPAVKSPWDLGGDADGLFGTLGDGLLAIDDETEAAWLHVGSDGRVTIASGKVDMGQGSTAELVRVVAQELRVAPDRVRAIMGDTDLSPYDMGTFGSLTTPHVVPAVVRVACAARRALERRAASAWAIGVDAVEAADACVTSRDGRRAASYAELVAGERLVERATTAGGVEPLAAWRLVGEGTPVTDATDVVTGRRRYTSDLSLPDMLHARVLRPPAIGATLSGLDTSDAAAIPGVTVVEEDGFVAVAAPSPWLADEALAALHATWTPGPGHGEAELIGHLREHPLSIEGWGGAVREERGDVDAALAAAEVRSSATYTTAFLAHEPLETRAALARWDGDRLTVWTGTQRPFGAREALAAALGIPEAQVRVIAAPTGSAFGGKHTAEVAVEAARVARAARRPVKVRWTREEETSWGYFRPAAVIDVRSGATADGRITAWELLNLNSGGRTLEPPYRIPAWRVAYQPADAPLRQGSYRALSATANTFARESQVDEIAAATGQDPYELRMGQLADARLAEALRVAAERIGWPGRQPGFGRGMGLACGIEKDARVATCVEVRAAVDAPLEILRVVTAFECGRIVDPDNLASQVEGALVMGLGGALFEAIHFADGRVTNAAQSAYRVPRFSDLPSIEVLLLDRPDLPSAGAGETPIIALAPALANAIFAATGVRLRSLPLVPDGAVRRPG